MRGRPPADAIARFRCIGDATDGDKQCVIASGDWNITAQELHRSGILDGMGLSIIWLEDHSTTCSQGKGSLLKYSVIIKIFLSLVKICIVVQCVPCGAHKKGFAQTFYVAPPVCKSKLFENR